MPPLHRTTEAPHFAGFARFGAGKGYYADSG